VVLLLGFGLQESWRVGRSLGTRSLFTLVVGVTIVRSRDLRDGSGRHLRHLGHLQLAQGAMGMFCAFIYWELKVNHDVQPLVGLATPSSSPAPSLGAADRANLMRATGRGPWSPSSW